MLGLVLAFTVLITRSLWLAFGIHWGANIAFELSNSAMQTKPLVQHNETTWVLAISWAVSLGLLIIFNRNTIKNGDKMLRDA